MPLYRSSLLLSLLLLLSMVTLCQEKKEAPGLITGNILDEKKKAVSQASVELRLVSDSLSKKATRTDKDGNFSFEQIPFGYYRLKITYVGYQPLVIDSINLRMERYDFNLSDLTLKPNTDAQLEEVVVYAEKPLIQSRDGNITFNAGESALSAGANASELLKSVPLVANDPDGKLVVRGKEPKILIDDKPVELNAQQLQDFLESLPGSMIERIEVMTNPPPQYANESGGVINIITRKGRVGLGARLSLTGGTRGEAGISGNINYRKKGLAINLNLGAAYNVVDGNGYSKRQNIYKDSTNYYNTTNNYHNRSTRPNARLSIDYEIDPRNLVNVLMQFNQHIFRNRSDNEFTNLNQQEDIYKLSNRFIQTEGGNASPDINVTYTRKGKKPGETLRLIAGLNYSYNQNDRTFFQQFLFPDGSPTGVDSTQQQLGDTWNHGYHIRLNYDKLLDNKRTTISTGGAWNQDASDVLLNTQFLRKPGNEYEKSELLSNDFGFTQTLSNLRFAVKQQLAELMSITGGLAIEATRLSFNLRDKSSIGNDYLTWLPFANFRKEWKDVLSVSLAYRKTIRRPGITQLNPSIDYGDPNNIRYGNPGLAPTTSHNFDLVFGRTSDQYYINLGMGYNLVQKVFSQIRTRQPDGTTETTWENIDDRHEYELSTWSGYTFSRQFRVNFSASYTYNKYSLYDRNVNKYRNGGTLTSNFNANYVPQDVWNITTGITYNRFANPQGTVRSNIRMNIGIQRKFFNKKFIVTFNMVDPFNKQEYRSFTYGPNYSLESFNSTATRNFRLTLGYNFVNLGRKSKQTNPKILDRLPKR